MLVESFEGGDRESTSTFFRPERARERERESERVSERARESGRKADTHFQPSEKRTRQLWPKRRIIIDPSESLSSPFSGLFLLSLSLSLSLFLCFSFSFFDFWAKILSRQNMESSETTFFVAKFKKRKPRF